MSSQNYDKIRGVVTNPAKAIEVTYQAETRKMVPFVLGTNQKNAADVEAVLCFQYAGSNPNLPKGWRCFNVNSLTTVSEIAYSPVPGVPPKIKFKEVKKQSSVDDVDVWRH